MNKELFDKRNALYGPTVEKRLKQEVLKHITAKIREKLSKKRCLLFQKSTL